MPYSDILTKVPHPHRTMRQAAHAVLALNLLRHGSVLHRRTRIVATLGPASCTREVVSKLVTAGVDVVRLNFSHGKAKDKLELAEIVREESRSQGRHVAVMCDLQGPKIRVGTFPGGGVDLKVGETLVLDAELEGDGSAEVCGVDYKGLPGDVSPGDSLLLNDGLIRLVVSSVDGPRVTTTVRNGGYLGSHKGINKAHGGLTAPALTEKDIEDIETVAQMKADYAAISFPKDGDDMRLAKRLIKEAVARHHPPASGAKPHIVRTVAKVERCEAVENLEDVIHASDAVMVARGDLGVEVGQASVPGIQKRIVHLSRRLGKPVIVATQMMESMITNPVPTRAEVSDVANAVLDGTDGVMLSAESAAGQYPVESVEWLHRICLEAEASDGATGESLATGHAHSHNACNSDGTPKLLTRGAVPVSGVLSTPRLHARISAAASAAAASSHSSPGSSGSGQGSSRGPLRTCATIDEGLAVGALFSAAHTGCRVLACVTETGETALRMSRATHDLPIIAVTTNESTARRVAMFSGVTALLLDSLNDTESVIADVRVHLLEGGFAKAGDIFGFTYGEPVGVAGGTNTLTIRKI